jgi:hypothetical protein
MTNIDSLTPDSVEHIEVLEPSQYSLQVAVDENGNEKINLSIHCSPKQMGEGRLRVSKDASGNYSVGFVHHLVQPKSIAQAKPHSDDNWKKSLELYKDVLKTIED